MKRCLLVFLAVVFLFVPAASAQDAMLTKEETVNYLNKKLQETDGRPAYIKQNGKTYNRIHLGLSFKLVGEKVEFRGKSKSEHLDADTTINNTCSFNPAYIKDVRVGNVDGYPPVKGSPVLVAVITLSGNLARCRMTDYRGRLIDEGDYGVVRLPFLDAAPGNRTRMEKAIRHLSDLAKAEEDPFGN